MLPHLLHNKEYFWNYDENITYFIFLSSFNHKYLKLIKLDISVFAFSIQFNFNFNLLSSNGICFVYIYASWYTSVYHTWLTKLSICIVIALNKFPLFIYFYWIFFFLSSLSQLCQRLLLELYCLEESDPFLEPVGPEVSQLSLRDLKYSAKKLVQRRRKNNQHKQWLIT